MHTIEYYLTILVKKETKQTEHRLTANAVKHTMCTPLAFFCASKGHTVGWNIKKIRRKFVKYSYATNNTISVRDTSFRREKAATPPKTTIPSILR